ncbi:hypothetical protein Tsubulata_008789 [Turnera subulata]|uniref:Uncharacterized protein n=1 Tax=Turnera subulata TaxID=218843 RepID=A0A9Q0JMF9_9ROSI|nr:hypothetical protein Tsubulata_008789 [Turnera subulata]
MLILHTPFVFQLPPNTTLTSHFSRQTNSPAHFLPVTLPKQSYRRTRDSVTFAAAGNNNGKEEVEVETEENDGPSESHFWDNYGGSRKGFPSSSGFRGRVGNDKDPEYAEILGDIVTNPEKARTKLVERMKKKRSTILQTKTGSDKPMKVTFNKFDFTDSYIWFEFYNTPLEKDVSLICNAIRAWHIIGRLGGCNSLNLQLSESEDSKRPEYDAIEAAKMEPTTFYNIGDLEIQENLARIWVDIGIAQPLLLDVLINALTQISTDYIGIKQLVFGGSEFENWDESLKSEDAGYSVHKI